MSDGGNGQASLQDTFKEQAEWRREKAKEYPADERNLKAASAFDRLAATVDAIPRDVFEAYSELGGVHDGLLDVERWTEMLRDVGFNSAPETAEDFIRSFIADRTARGGSRQISPGPVPIIAPCPPRAASRRLGSSTSS